VFVDVEPVSFQDARLPWICPIDGAFPPVDACGHRGDGAQSTSPPSGRGGGWSGRNVLAKRYSVFSFHLRLLKFYLNSNYSKLIYSMDEVSLNMSISMHSYMMTLYIACELLMLINVKM